LQKKRVFWTFWRFSGWISVKIAFIYLVKNAFATQQLAALATSIAFYDILARARSEIKILRKYLGFSNFEFFFSLFLFLLFFSFCCSD